MTVPGRRTRTLHLAEEEKVVLRSGGKIVAVIEFSISEQSLTVSVHGRGSVANPILLSVDTEMLGHSETEDDSG